MTTSWPGCSQSRAPVKCDSPGYGAGQDALDYTCLLDCMILPDGLLAQLAGAARVAAVRKDAKARPLIDRRLPRLPFATACPLPLAIDLEGPLSAPALACPAQRWRPPAAG